METRFEELKRYVRFGEEDARALAAFRRTAEPHFARIVQQFYDRIREHERAHAVFTGEEQIQRLQKSLLAWLHRLLGGTYDEAYFERTSAIGHMHVKVGLPQHYMFTAMALIRVELTRIAEKEADDPRVREALTRLIDLELAIMLEAYRDHFVARIQRSEQLEKQALSENFERAEHRYLQALEHAGMLVVGLDRNGAVQLFNRTAEQVTGYGREEIIGSPFVEILLPEELVAKDGARFKDGTAGILGVDAALESAVRTRSGNVRDVRWQLAYVPAAPNQEVVLFAFGIDTTEGRAAHERAQQQERLAAVGTLAAGLAHEIRNPLNGALLHVSFLERALRKSDAGPDLFEAVGVVGDEIKRLAVLVTEFLEFARPRPLALKPAGLRAICERTRHLVESEAKKAHVDLTCDLPADDLALLVDPPKIEQVLLNLVQNAIEALTSRGGGHVVVRARRQPRHVRIEVEDDGPGLPSEDAPIFDAFFSTKPNGTGLGLAIVHRIVTDHRGTIDVESRPGRTVFRVTLPLDLNAASPPRAPAGNVKGSP